MSKAHLRDANPLEHSSDVETQSGIIYGTGDVTLKDLPPLLKQKADGRMTIGSFTLTRTGLQINGEFEEKDWSAALDTVGKFGQSVQWILGDLLNIGGEREYKTDYQLVAEKTGYEVPSLRNFVYVCANVELSRRRDKLKFGHHQEVAKLLPSEQDYWLKKAETEKLSISQMRKDIDVWLNGAPTPPPTPEQITVSEIRGQTSDFIGRVAKVRHDPALRRELRDLLEGALRMIDAWDEEG